MNADDTYTVEPLNELVVMPAMYDGGYERVTNTRTQESSLVLHVWLILESGRSFVGSFYGQSEMECKRKFNAWFCGSVPTTLTLP